MTTQAALRAPWSVKGAMGFSGAVAYVVFLSFELFVLFYYNQVLGLPATLAGLALLIGTLIDAVTDPLLGNLSDNIRHRWGRRHVMMFASIVPVFIAFVAVFSPPEGLPEWGLFLWLTVSIVAVRISLGLYDGPVSALAAEISPLKSDRAEIGIARQVISALTQLGMLAVAFGVFFAASEAYPNGQENPDAYPPFAVFTACLLIGAIAISSLGTWRHMLKREQGLPPPPPGSPLNPAQALQGWIDMLFSTPNFRAVFIALLVAGIMGSTYRGLNLYLGTYLWELDPQTIRDWQQLSVVGMLVMALAARLVVHKVEPKHVYMAGFGGLILGYVMPPALTWFGLLPAAGDPLLSPILLSFNFLAGASMGLLMIGSLMVFSEVSDEYEFLRGVSRTGLLFGVITFGNKAASGLGKVIAGGILDLIGFPTAEEIERLTPQMLNELAMAVTLVTAIIGGLALAILGTYHLPRARHDHIVATLDQRRRQNAAEEPRPVPAAGVATAE